MRLPVLLAVDDDSRRSRRRRDAARPALRARLSDRVPRRSRRRVADAAGARATEARTWRSCSPHRRSRRPRGVISSSTCVSCTRTPGARCSFRRTSGPIQPTAEAIRDSMALGRIDYYVPRPAGPIDEVFHEAISSFLLEWARDRRRRAADGAHRRRDVVRPGLRAAGGPRAMRHAARLLPRGVGAGARAARHGGPRREASADGASRRHASERPVQRRDRRGRRCSSGARGARLRRGRRRLAGPRASRQPCTAPRRGCASSWWTRAASADRPGRAR